MTKKLLHRCLIILCLAIFGFAGTRGNATPSAKSLSWDTQLFLKNHKIASLQEYVRWLEANVRYISDKDGDQWQSPQETVDKKSGDCEDLAFLHAEILNAFGFHPMVIAHGRGKQAHVYTVFKNGDVLFTLENTHMANTGMKNLHDMSLFLANKENAEYLLELSFSPKTIRTLYTMTRKTPS